ncbi:hypothetical protein VCHA50O413_70191 [Vibrio chagasii]|nr:hypothetical protein VCHA32O87_190053 [Vibrio chagasii]CAH7047727.1 hypothetical protein VCHA43P284_190052 [Vibrio chagasii]CAH7160696.1 hypothetical protein VCHA48O428_240023 [Vibrio chagasii]CAH7231041.1 hypothetical protein VCHA39O224_180053 [Vibrio chagasii]CAH7367067.1 hypothetical protein VCHA50O402_60190 [Vibrio chagasii]
MPVSNPNNVDLPQPLGPFMKRCSWAWICREGISRVGGNSGFQRKLIFSSLTTSDELSKDMLAPIIKAVYLLDSSSRHKFPEHTDLNSQVSSHLLGCLFYV